MRTNITLSILLTLSAVFAEGISYGQSAAQPMHVYINNTAQRQANGTNGNSLNNAQKNMTVVAKNAMTALPVNYKYFTQPQKNTSAEALEANKKYLQHPEANLLFAGTPCDNCYELIEKRTETTKTFTKEGKLKSGSKEVMTQTSNMPMHYRDAQGNWRTIKTHLQPDATNRGVFAATEQPVPVSINTTGVSTFAQLGKPGEKIQFNKDLELVFVAASGSETTLGKANWTRSTAGDEGVYVTDAWPGVDIEMRVYRGAIKTNFIINRAMPAYAGGNLRVRDHVQMDNGMLLAATDGTSRTNGPLEIKTSAGDKKYIIAEAIVSEHNDGTTVKQLQYVLGNNNILDIELPGSYLNKPATSYPVTIDPLVTQVTAVPVNGASYNATWAAGAGCLYTNPANTPPNCTVTDIQFSFEYISNVARLYCAFSFYKGGCRNPGPAAGGLSWSCNNATSGTCTSAGGATYSIFSDLSPCLPPPSCPSIPLNIDMYFYQNWANTAACATTYVYGSQPWVITVIGRTVEINGGNVSASPAAICAGASSTLSGTGIYGVPPYNWSWTPGPLAGSPVVVTPATTTNYTGTVTDACGITATANTTVTVYPVNPITGPTTVCAGNTINLSNATGSGTWSSATPGVATVNTNTGVVGGVSAGTAVIRYTAIPGACVSTTTITVTPLPGAISGNTVLCLGSTSTLSDPAAGGTWTSSNTNVATIDPNSGVVSSVSSGTTTITYSFGGSCFVTTNLNVNPLTPINGPTALCVSETATFSNATSPGTWSSSNAAVAVINTNTGTLTPGAAGNTVITYTTNAGCSATLNLVITPIPGAITGDTTICQGSTSTLGNSAAGGVWSSSNNVVATISSTGVVTAVTPGFTTIGYSFVGSCATSANVEVYPVAPIIGATAVCEQSMTTLTNAVPGGVWSTDNAALATVNATSGTVSGVSGGTVNVTYTTPQGCPSTFALLVNALPTTSNVSVHHPTQCDVADGSITLNPLNNGSSYGIDYIFEGATTSSTLVAAGGNVVIQPLANGNYTGIFITDLGTGCVYHVPNQQLLDPAPPPPPVITDNQPVCAGQTLKLFVNDDVSGGTYLWAGPNGFTSVDQAIIMDNVQVSATGPYTVVYTLNNCPSATTKDVTIYPPLVLLEMTPAQTIKYGATVQLSVQGALYYEWMPNDGSIDNPNINNPIAKPEDATVYTVIGTNVAGCRDTATVLINVDHTVTEFIPSAFTPNGDGLNDVFRVVNMKYQKLVEFTVYNRWGQLVYQNRYDLKQGWDGTFNGVPQDMGVYTYKITVITAEGVTRNYKGDVMLVR